jgi:aminoglycoside 3-N-acetyltransferase I
MNEQITVKRLEADDLQLLQRLVILFHRVFEADEKIMAAEDYHVQLLENPAFIAMVAMDGKEIVGGLTAYLLPMYYRHSAEAYIYDIAVADAHQRKGLGRALIESLKEYCRQNGISTIFVEAHEEDTHAVAFYKSLGGQMEKVAHFNFEL